LPLAADRISWELSIVSLSLTAFTLVNLLTKSKKHKTDLMLAIWLILLNIPSIHTILFELRIRASLFTLLTNPTLNLLQGPMLFLYVRMLINRKPEVHIEKEIIHFIPFAFLYAVFISIPQPQLMRPSPNRLYSLAGPGLDNPLLSIAEPFLRYFGVINALFFIAYSIAVIALLMKHKKVISEIFSQNDNQISLKWIYALPITYFLLVVLNFSYEAFTNTSLHRNPLTLHMMSFLCIIVLLCFFGVKQKPIFYSSKSTSPHTKSDEPLTPSDTIEQQTESLTEPEATEAATSDPAADELIQKMQHYMTTEKPYQDPEFSVYTLAEALNVPRRTLSTALNSCLSKNFYQYVNEFRLEEVKLLLQQPDKQQQKIIDLAFQAGFKSKSSFNSLFKQYCGVTPTQYRKQFQQ
jgi:AraC-like DNA-binding protein